MLPLPEVLSREGEEGEDEKQQDQAAKHELVGEQPAQHPPGQQQHGQQRDQAAKPIGEDLRDAEAPGEQDGRHVQAHDQRRVHVDEVHVQPLTSQDACGLVQQEPRVGTGVASEMGGEAEAGEQGDPGEEDGPMLERRLARGPGFDWRQECGEGADSSAGSTQGARCGELYWPLR